MGASRQTKTSKPNRIPGTARRTLPGVNEAELLQAGLELLVGNEAIENGQDLLAIGVNAMEVLAEGGLEIVGPHPLLEHRARYVYILPEGIDIVSPEKQPVKEGCLSLGRQGVEIVSGRHKTTQRNCKYSGPLKLLASTNY